MVHSPVKSVLITGCSDGGIGHALALELHRKGLRVIATARRLQSISSLAAVGIEVYELDVGEIGSINSLHDQVDRLLSGKLDYLVNNAGIDYASPAIDSDMVKVRQVFETNVLGLIQMCQSFAGMLVAASGTIVNHSSVLGTSIAIPFGSHYNASKAAVLSYSNTLRVELEPLDVKVVTLITGEVKSNVLRSDPKLPETSLYKIIESKFAIRAGAPNDSSSHKMSTEEYARIVVGKLLVAHPPRQVWAGTNAWAVWSMTRFFPQPIHSKLTGAQFNLGKVKVAYRSREKNA